MANKLVWISGTQDASSQEFDDNGKNIWKVEGGTHNKHVVTKYTSKYNCGAYGVEMICSCGSSWCNHMNGCWQYGHQREEFGDQELNESKFEHLDEPNFNQ